MGWDIFKDLIYVSVTNLKSCIFYGLAYFWPLTRIVTQVIKIMEGKLEGKCGRVIQRISCMSQIKGKVADCTRR